MMPIENKPLRFKGECVRCGHHFAYHSTIDSMNCNRLKILGDLTSWCECKRFEKDEFEMIVFDARLDEDK
jgi:hypothetical protein